MAPKPSKPAAGTKANTRAARASARTDEFVCSVCGRTFSRAAALGAHRSRAHGIAGQSAQAKKRRSSGQASRRPAASTSPSKVATGEGRSAREPTNRRATGSKGSGGRNGIDRDVLLKAVFPNGIPASEDVIRAASDWLDDAERLTSMR
jgi:hypothetical protein